MKKSAVIAATLVLLGGTICFAQSNEMIDKLLEREQADFGSSVYMTLSAGKIIDEGASVEEALTTYQTLGWRLQSKTGEDTVSISELSYLIMKSLQNERIFYGHIGLKRERYFSSKYQQFPICL